MNEWVEALIEAVSTSVPDLSGDRSWRQVLLFFAGTIGLLVLCFWLILRG